MSIAGGGRTSIVGVSDSKESSFAKEVRISRSERGTGGQCVGLVSTACTTTMRISSAVAVEDST